MSITWNSQITVGPLGHRGFFIEFIYFSTEYAESIVVMKKNNFNENSEVCSGFMWFDLACYFWITMNFNGIKLLSNVEYQFRFASDQFHLSIWCCGK